MCLHVAVWGGGPVRTGRLQGKELSSFTIYYYSHPAPVLTVRPALVRPCSYWSSPLFLLSVWRLHSSGFRAGFTNMRICLQSSFTIYNYYSHPAPVLTVRPTSVRPCSYCPSGFSPPLFLLSVRLQSTPVLTICPAASFVRIQGQLHEYANMPSLLLYKSRLSTTSKPSPTINVATSWVVGTLYQQASFIREAMKCNFKSMRAPFVAITSLAILNTST